MNGEELLPFLNETKYCNFNNPEIKKITQEITEFCTSEKEKIIALFNWVKENIKFEFSYWGIDAVQTLKKGSGMCTNKSNLLIAFLRALKIPAGYGILKVKTDEFYGSLMCPFFKKLVSPQSVHIYAGVFLEGKWMRCDPSVDSELARVLEKKNPFAEFSGFNLKENEIKKIKGILEKKEFLANIDEELSKPPKNLREKVLNLGNQYLLFLRRNETFIKNLKKPEK
jgi:transglutaminase-like putative cysteine protease